MCDLAVALMLQGALPQHCLLLQAPRDSGHCLGQAAYYPIVFTTLLIVPAELQSKRRTRYQSD
jgi:hypothetical protein